MIMSKKTKSKSKRKGRSLFVKYYSSIAATVGGALLFMGFFLTIVIAVQWWNDKVDTLKQNAQNIVSTLEDIDVSHEEPKVLKEISRNLSVVSNATNSDLFYVDTEGEVLICAHSDGQLAKESTCAEHSKLKIEVEHMEKALKDGFSEYSTVTELGYGVFMLAVPVKQNGVAVGAVYAVEDAITGLVPYVLNIMETVFVVTITALAICFVVIYFLCKGITVPIEEMKGATRHFAKGEFDYKAKEDYKLDSLNEFAHSLNKMAGDLAVENEAQKSFVANVSHELKTPMTTIGGFVDGIRDGTIPPEREMEYLDIVSGEVKRLTRMVYAMLNLSKIESGEVSISPIKYDIGSQIFETLLPFEKAIEDKNVSIAGFEDIEQVTVTADKDLIQQVIYNLFDNAVKFVDEGGTITVYAKNEDGATVVGIRNTGKGISQEEISRIFERFYKVDKSRSFDKKGVGLGLYIVKTIVNMHGGEISASSVEGEYTQFEFSIPDGKNI